MRFMLSSVAPLVVSILFLSSQVTGQETLYQSYYSAASNAFKAKDWEAARRSYQSSYDAAVAAWGKEDARAAECIFNVGASIHSSGDIIGARKYYTMAYTATFRHTDKLRRELAIESALKMSEGLIKEKRPADAIPYLEWGMKATDDNTKDLPPTYKFHMMLTEAYRDLKKFDLALEHGKLALEGRTKGLSQGDDKAISAKWDYASLLEAAGKPQPAEKMYNEIIGDLESRVLPDRLKLGHMCYNIALLRKAAKNYDGADEAAQQALKNYDKAGEEGFTHALDALGRLAQIRYDQQKFADGDEYQRKKLSREEKKYSETDPKLLGTLEDLGWSLSQQKRFADAEEILRRAVNIRRLTDGSQSPSIVYSLNLLASMLAQQDKSDEAETAYRQVLSIRKKQSTDAELATALTNLTSFYEKAGQPDRAEQLFQETIRDREKERGVDHPSLAPLLSAYGAFAWRSGKHDAAESLFKRTLANREKNLPADHPDIAESLLDLSDFYEVLGRYAEAEPLAIRAVQIRDRKFGSNSVEAAAAARKLAWIYNRLDREREGLPLAERAVSIYEAKKPGTSELAAAYNTLSTLLDGVENIDRAAGLLRRALVIHEANGDIPDSAHLHHNLGRLERMRGQYTEAKAMYLRSIELNDQLIAMPTTVLTTQLNRVRNKVVTLNALAQVEINLGNTDAARQRFAEAITLAEKELGAEHTVLEQSLHGQANLAMLTGNLREAEAFLDRNQKLIEAHAGRASLDWANHLEQVSSLREMEGKLAESRTLLAEALKIYEAQERKASDLVWLHSEIADLAVLDGDWKAAEQWFAKEIDHYITLRANHPFLASPLRNRGFIHQMKGRFADARKDYVKAVTLSETAYGPRSASVAAGAQSLFDLELELADLDAAEQMLTKAVPILEAWYGPGNFRMENMRLKQSNLASARHDWEQAEKSATVALENYRKVFGNDHYNVAEAEECLSEALLGRGELAPALAACDHALEVISKVYGAQNYRVASLQSLRGRILQKQGDLKQAREEHKLALALRRTTFGRDSHWAALSEAELADTLEAGDKTESREDLLRHALKILEQTFPAGHPKVKDSAEKLAKALTDADQADQAAELRKKYDLPTSATK